MSLRFLIEVLKARWVLTLSLLLITLVTTMVISLMISKSYSATAALVVDIKSPDPLTGMVMPGMLTASYMATQIDIIQSDKTLRKAIASLGLDKSPQVREQWQSATDGKGDFTSWLVDLISKGLSVKPSRESNVINVTFTAADPNFATAMANAIVNAYQRSLLELRVEPARQFSDFFDAQAEKARKKLLDAQAALSNYQQKNGIIATDERFDVENNRLNELSSQLVALQAIHAEARGRSLTGGANSPEVLGNPVVAALKADTARLEARVKELTARFGSAHPTVLEQQASLYELRSRAEAEINRVKSSLQVNEAVNKAREREVLQALAQQRSKVLQLKEQRDAAAVLLQDVSSAQRAYDAIQAKQAQTYVESQSNQTNVAVLKEATVPAAASSPSLMLNSALALVLGSMLAIAITLATEFSDRRLRTDEDITELLGTVVIGEIAQSSPKKRIDNIASNAAQHLLPSN